MIHALLQLGYTGRREAWRGVQCGVAWRGALTDTHLVIRRQLHSATGACLYGKISKDASAKFLVC